MAISEGYVKAKKAYGAAGTFQKHAVKMDDVLNTSGAGKSAENPFSEDMVILEAYVDVTGADSTAGATVDIGLADSVTGTNADAVIGDETIVGVLGVYECLPAQAVTGGTARPLWKKANALHTAVDSFVCTYPGTTGGTADAVYNLIVVVAPKAAFD